jgi:hypothetical protein
MKAETTIVVGENFEFDSSQKRPMSPHNEERRTKSAAPSPYCPGRRPLRKEGKTTIAQVTPISTAKGITT